MFIDDETKSAVDLRKTLDDTNQIRLPLPTDDTTPLGTEAGPMPVLVIVVPEPVEPPTVDGDEPVDPFQV